MSYALMGGPTPDGFVFTSLTGLGSSAFRVPGRTIDGGAGFDILDFAFNADYVPDSDWAGVTQVELLFLEGTGYQNLQFGPLAAASFGPFLIVLATGSGGMNIDASSLPFATQLITSGTTGGDTITGGDGRDFITGTGGNDWLRGMGGNDTFIFDSVANLTQSRLDGGAGIDQVVVFTSGTVTDGAFSGKSNVEGLYLAGGGAQSVALGSNASNAFAALIAVSAPVAATLSVDASGVGPSTGLLALGTVGADTLTGGAWQDDIRGGGGADILSGGAQDDTFRFLTNAQLVIATIDGGGGYDTVDIQGDNFGSGALANSTGIERVVLTTLLSPVLNFMLADADANAFTGRVARFEAAGASLIGLDANAFSAASHLVVVASHSLFAYGGAGSDTFLSGDGSLYVDAHGGDDIIYVQSEAQLAGSTLNGGAGVDIVYLRPTIDHVQDSDFSTKLGLEHLVFETTGAVSASFGALASAAFGNNLTVWATSSAGAVLDGSSVIGFSAVGGFGADVLIGGAGADNLTGRGGQDMLTGGLGADIFHFGIIPPGTGTGADTITDFVHGVDRIALDGGYSADSIQAILVSAQNTADGALLHYNGGFILLAGVAAATLTTGDFLFG